MMSNIIKIFFLLHATIAVSQNALIVDLERCKSGHYDGRLFETVSLFRNDSLIHKAGDGKIIYSDLPNGRYHVEYQTFFGPVKSDYFILDKNELYDYIKTFCVDELSLKVKNVSNYLFVNEFQNEEKIIIHYEYGGCFNSGKDIILIEKNKDKYFITHKARKRKLRKKDLVALREFEMELRNVKSADYNATGGSSTSMTFKNVTIEFAEPAGYWEGYDDLKRSLKLD